MTVEGGVERGASTARSSVVRVGGRRGSVGERRGREGAVKTSGAARSGEVGGMGRGGGGMSGEEGRGGMEGRRGETLASGAT